MRSAFLLLLLSSTLAVAEEPKQNGQAMPSPATDPRAAVQMVLDKLSPGQWQGVFAFTNYRTDKTTTHYTISILSKDSTLVHLSFLEPERDKGRQVLNKNGQIWSYLPDSKKIVRLADRDSLAGGDFSNTDVLKLNWLDDYDPVLAKDGATQVVVDLRARKDRAPAYHQVRLWIQRETLQPVQQYFYDDAGHHLKTLKYRDIKTFGNLTRPATMVMENVVTGQRTVLEVREFAKADKVPAQRFSIDQLGK